MTSRSPLILCAAALALASAVAAAERAVDPTWLYRSLDAAPVIESDLTAPGCEYRPLFGAGDSQEKVPAGVVRFGELRVNPGASCTETVYDREEQIYYVLSGKGEALYRGEIAPVSEGDFAYFAPTAEHSASNAAGTEPLRILVMGFRVAPDLDDFGVPVKLPVANQSEAKLQVVGNHPPTTLYRLLLGDVTSRRDLLSTAHTVTSLFIMEFAPGGTNFPHHHLRDEEVYILLDGEGEMVAGGGADGVEGKRPAKPGDAYYYRPNATVGFYASKTPRDPSKKARILAIRSVHPAMFAK